MKRYGETWLTKPRWVSANRQLIEDSPWSWRRSVNEHSESDSWTLAYIGILNGITGFFKLAFVVKTDESGENIVGYGIKRRWW